MELHINWIFLTIILGGVCIIVACVVLLCFLVYHHYGKQKVKSLHATEIGEEQVPVRNRKLDGERIVSRKSLSKQQAPWTSSCCENLEDKNSKCQRCHEEQWASWKPVLGDFGQSLDQITSGKFDDKAYPPPIIQCHDIPCPPPITPYDTRYDPNQAEKGTYHSYLYHTHPPKVDLHSMSTQCIAPISKTHHPQDQQQRDTHIESVLQNVMDELHKMKRGRREQQIQLMEEEPPSITKLQKKLKIQMRQNEELMDDLEQIKDIQKPTNQREHSEECPELGEVSTSEIQSEDGGWKDRYDRYKFGGRLLEENQKCTKLRDRFRSMIHQHRVRTRNC